jgi:hypothetical protein
MKTRAVRATVLTGAALLVAFPAGATDSHTALRPSDASRASIDGSVRIVVRFASATRGAFAATGAIVDQGAMVTTRRASSGRLHLTQTLTGRLGTVRIRSTQSCAGGSGTWRVLSGTKAYAGLFGGGSAKGAPRCASPRYPVRGVYSGTVRTPPPPPLAQPGEFGGGTSQREEVVLTVQEGGRTFSGLRLRIETTCVGTPITSVSFISFPAVQAIADDGGFSLMSSAGTATSTVAGRFTSLTSVEGTAKATGQITISAGNATYPCAGEVTWRATLPPPAATPGTYCGFTNQGPSVCLDVAAGGRMVTRIQIGVVVLCNQRTTEVEVTLEFNDLPLRGNLGFGQGLSSIEGFISGTASVTGLLDPDGGTGAHGSVRLQLPVFDHEGSRYTCGVGTALWEARRQ